MSLTVIVGCMFSAKSTTLINKVRIFRDVLHKEVLVIGYSGDTRSGQSVRSHNGLELPCITIPILQDIFELESYNDADVIAVEEGQFYEDLLDATQKMLQDGKIVMIAGLLGDRFQKPIGQIVNILPLAEDILFLKAYCAVCRDGTLATFTKYIGAENSENSVLVGGSESYLPVCQKHYSQ